MSETNGFNLASITSSLNAVTLLGSSTGAGAAKSSEDTRALAPPGLALSTTSAISSNRDVAASRLDDDKLKNQTLLSTDRLIRVAKELRPPELPVAIVFDCQSVY